MLNKVILIGYVGQDPVITNTQAGKRIANFSLATSNIWKDKQTGERKERTEWHRVVVYNSGLADVCDRYLNKGSKVYVEGQLQTRAYKKDGVEKSVTEIVLQNYSGNLILLDSKAEKSSVGQNSSDTVYTQPEGMSNGAESYSDLLDDDVPF